MGLNKVSIVTSASRTRQAHGPENLPRRPTAPPRSMPPPSRIVSLITDFGTADPFVGIMKAVILSRCREATLIDVTHETPPQDIFAGAFALASAWRYFPAGTIHVVVVDPGVGSDRRILLAEVDGHQFLVPDNGLLPLALDGRRPASVRAVERREFFLEPVSATFHGRDIFAPVAAVLAAGTAAPAEVGPRVSVASLVRVVEPAPRPLAGGGIRGEVATVDRFGNLITNVRAAQVPGASWRISVRGRTIDGISPCYGAVPAGEPLAVIGSTGRLEIAVNLGDAATVLEAERGTLVEIQPTLS